MKCWDSTVFPVERKFQCNMKLYSWKYTQSSAFNETDSLLLVSGVIFGPVSSSGEIVVFALEENFPLRCKVRVTAFQFNRQTFNDPPRV